MGVSEWVGVGLFIFGAIFTVIGYLLSQRDKKQEENIKELFIMVGTLKTKDSEIELYVSRNYYSKEDIGKLFEDLKQHMDQRFDHLEQRRTTGQ